MKEIRDILDISDGYDQLVIYISSLKAMKRMGANMGVSADQALLAQLKEKLGENNVKVLEKSIEK